MDQCPDRQFADISPMVRHRLKRDIALIVSIKVVIVLCAGLFVFGPRSRPHVDAVSVGDQMLRDLPSGQNNGNPPQ